MPFCDSRLSNNLCSLANSKTKSTTLNNFSLLFQSHMAKSFCLSRGPTGTNRTLHKTSNKDIPLWLMITAAALFFERPFLQFTSPTHVYVRHCLSYSLSNLAFRCTTGLPRCGRWLEDGRWFPTFCPLKHQLFNLIWKIKQRSSSLGSFDQEKRKQYYIYRSLATY